MGVYIKNFKMPPPGKYRACVIVDEFGARLTVDVATSYSDRDLRVDPIFPVPPRGRLGDLDALEETIEALIEKHLHGYTKSTWDFVCELRSIISNAPTIITAEEAEE